MPTIVKDSELQRELFRVRVALDLVEEVERRVDSEYENFKSTLEISEREHFILELKEAIRNTTRKGCE